jgi:hypothetical protein
MKHRLSFLSQYQARVDSTGRAIGDYRHIPCSESFSGTMKVFAEVQSREHTLGFLLLAFVRDAVASNSASLLLHYASRLATDFSALTYPTYMSFHLSINNMALLHCASH